MLSRKRFLNILGGCVIALSLMFSGNFAFAEVDLGFGADTKMIYKEKKKKSGKKTGKKANKNSVAATH